MSVKEAIKNLSPEAKANIAAMLTEASMPHYETAKDKALEAREISYMAQNVTKLYEAIFDKLLRV